jgi:hypothetical protein
MRAKVRFNPPAHEFIRKFTTKSTNMQTGLNESVTNGVYGSR